MFILSKRATVLLVCAGVVLLTLIALVYYVYISPVGLMAKRNSDISQVESKAESLYVTIDNEEIELTKYDGEILVVNVWASWSPYTKTDHEVLQRIKDHFGDRITIRAVNRKEDRETVIAYLDSIGRQEGVEYIIDTTDFLFTTLDGYAMPETLIFDNVGNVSFHKRGTLSYDELVGEIESLIGNKE
jgi:thiol-disulfide isomerase/thioredoxin